MAAIVPGLDSTRNQFAVKKKTSLVPTVSWLYKNSFLSSKYNVDNVRNADQFYHKDFFSFLMTVCQNSDLLSDIWSLTNKLKTCFDNFCSMVILYLYFMWIIWDHCAGSPNNNNNYGEIVTTGHKLLGINWYGVFAVLSRVGAVIKRWWCVAAEPGPGQHKLQDMGDYFTSHSSLALLNIGGWPALHPQFA